MATDLGLRPPDPPSGPLALRGEVWVQSGSNISRVVGVSLNPATFNNIPAGTFLGNITGVAGPVRSWDEATFAGLNLSYNVSTDGGNFPTVLQRVAEAWTTAVTSQTYTYPLDMNIGDLLVIAIATGGLTTITPPAGWTLLNSAATASNRLSAYGRIIDGTEGATDTVTFGTASGALVRSWTIDRTDGTFASIATTAAVGTSLDIGAVTPPWASSITQNFYLVLLGLDVESGSTVTVFPGSYVNTGQDANVSTTASINGRLAFGERSIAGNSEDPTAFNFGSALSAGMIIAFKPTDAGRFDWDGLTLETDTSGVFNTRPTLNVIAGAGISLTATDDAINKKTDLTITNTGGGGGLPSLASDSFLGNISGVSATAAQVLLSAIASSSILYDATSHTFQLAAGTGDVTWSQNSTATTIAPLAVTNGKIANSAVSNAKMANMGSDNFKGNISGSSAAPADVGLNLLAGSGLSYSFGSHTYSVKPGAGGSLVVGTDVQRAALTGAVTAAQDSNVTAFGAATAKSVLANATNASAVPAYLAGSAAFQHLRVNSANTGLEWAVLAATSPITLSSDTFGFDQSVALGNNARVAVAKNSGATVGTRRQLNLIEGTNITITEADDSANERVNITIAAASTPLPSIATDTFLGNVSGSTATATAVNLSTLAGAGLVFGTHTLDVTAGAGGSLVVSANDIQRGALTGAITASQDSNATVFGVLVAKSVLANATNASAVPAALAGSAAFQHLRVNSGNTGLEWSVLTTGDFPANSVPLTALGTQAADTFVGNITALTATPIAVPLLSIDSASVIYDATSHTFQRAALTGDVTASQNSNATTIANNAVTLAKMATQAAHTFLANNTGVTAVPSAITGTQATAELDTFTSLLKGLVPASGGGTTNFLRADGSFAAPAGALPSIANNTVLGNISGATATAVAVPLTSLDSASIIANGANFERAALTGVVTASQNSNATAFGSAAALSVLINATNVSAVPSFIAATAGKQFLRTPSAGTSLVWATVDYNDLASLLPSDTVVGNVANTAQTASFVPLSGLVSGGVAGSLSYNSSSHVFQRAALTGDVTAGLDLNLTTISNSAVTNAKMANMANDTLKANISGASAAPSDVALSSLAGLGLQFASHAFKLFPASQSSLDAGIDNTSAVTSDLLGYRPGLNTLAAAVAATASTARVNAATYTIPAGTMVAGSTYMLFGCAVATRGATATACNLTVDITLAGTSRIATSAIAIATAAGNYGGFFLGFLTCYTTGTTGTGIAQLYSLDQISGGGHSNVSNLNAVFTINTTIANALTLGGVMSAAIASVSQTWSIGAIMRIK